VERVHERGGKSTRKSARRREHRTHAHIHDGFDIKIHERCNENVQQRERREREMTQAEKNHSKISF